jgi:hypothetical protein
MAIIDPVQVETALAPLASVIGPGAVAFIAASFVTIIVVLIILALAAYVYSALTLMIVAQKTGTEKAWLAWVPIGNLYLMSKIAEMHWWPILLMLATPIPLLGTIASTVFSIFTMVWTWKICEARGREGWWAILTLVPMIGWLWSPIMWGLLAWGEE